MTDFDEAAFSPEDEEQLWAGMLARPTCALNAFAINPSLDLDRCISSECGDHEALDDTLRSWLDLATKLRDRLYESQDDFMICARMLLASDLYRINKDYVRTQLIYSLLQEDERGSLHAIASLLLLEGQQDDATYPRMIKEACFPRLLELIYERREEDPQLHRLLLELMYEMSRVERLRLDDLVAVDDGFVHYLFRLIEEVSDDVHDPYHYPTIRVLVCVES